MAKPLVEVQTIYDTALRLLDEQGAEALSARNLAAALGCSTRTLYQQVGKREQLLEGLFNQHFKGLEVQFTQGDTWPETAYHWCTSLRASMLAHPNLSRLMTIEHREPVADYATRLLKVLLQAGFPRTLAFSSCRALANICVSLASAEISTPAYYASRKQRRREKMNSDDVLVASQPHGNHASPEVFTNTIRWTISGIAQEFATSASTRHNSPEVARAAKKGPK
jgi:AcrR family transcriptional regulator